MTGHADDTERRTVVVDEDAAGERLDRFLADRLPTRSRSQVQRMIDDGHVTRNDAPARRAATRLSDGDRLTVALPPEDEADRSPQPSPALSLTVRHEDPALIVVDKPSGQVVHPAAGHHGDTLVNALLARYPELGERFEGQRPGIVHRLDRDTSGVMVVARTPAAAEALKAQFKARAVEKQYLALVRGRLLPEEGIIDAPIGRDPARRKRMAAVSDGRPAQTRYRVLAQLERDSWVLAEPRTGRTHQIRVHFAALGHPVASDPIYGKRDARLGRLALHAWRLTLDHPTSSQRMTWTAPLPKDLAAALADIGVRPAHLAPEE